MTITITGWIYDLVGKRTFPGELSIKDGRISKIAERDSGEVEQQLLMPGLVDAHIHIESSLLTPQAFWSMAVTHGTLATVSDPHEIANVLGLAGVRYMVEALTGTPFITSWGAPSCVPATNSSIETAGARFSFSDILELLNLPEIGYLSEVMNFPAVLSRQAEIMSFIELAHERGKPVDGHAPGLFGEDAMRYASAGISTDHECTSLKEALDKIKAGMKILIREGSAAKNYDALRDLLKTHPDKVMFCSDDKHPHELRRGHINQIARRAIADGYELFSVLRAASFNPIYHYKLPLGLLQIGDTADFIVVESLASMKVMRSYLRGEVISEDGVCKRAYSQPPIVNNFLAKPIVPSQLELPAESSRIRVIQVIDGQLLTNEVVRDAHIVDGQAVSCPVNNLLKIVVVNRYIVNAKVAIGFCENFGLTEGAIASSVAHDSHNIVAVGVSDDHIAKAINRVIRAKGGLAVSSGKHDLLLPLPIAGLMSDLPGDTVANLYEQLHDAVSELGSSLHDALMMLSFMALPVIGELKMTDKGLFSTSAFSHVPLFLD